MSSNLAELVGIDVPTRLLIGGEWTGGRGGGTMPVIDPPISSRVGTSMPTSSARLLLTGLL